MAIKGRVKILGKKPAPDEVFFNDLNAGEGTIGGDGDTRVRIDGTTYLHLCNNRMMIEQSSYWPSIAAAGIKRKFNVILEEVE